MSKEYPEEFQPPETMPQSESPDYGVLMLLEDGSRRVAHWDDHGVLCLYEDNYGSYEGLHPLTKRIAGWRKKKKYENFSHPDLFEMPREIFDVLVEESLKRICAVRGGDPDEMKRKLDAFREKWQTRDAPLSEPCGICNQRECVCNERGLR